MIRQIVMPKEKNFTLQFPDEMIGKTIEVIAFEIEGEKETSIEISDEERIKKVRSIFADSLVDLSNFKFNRDQANEYDK